MRSINKVILIGNLTRDPEMRETPSGQKVVTFGLATNRDWVTKDGRKQSSAEFHDVVAWARLADICQQHLKKGKLVYVEGYLKTRSWDTPEGVKKFRTEIVVQDMIMLDKRESEGGAMDYIPEDHHESHMEVEQDRPAENPLDKKETPAPRAQTPRPARPEKHSEKDDSKTVPLATLDINADLGL